MKRFVVVFCEDHVEYDCHELKDALHWLKQHEIERYGEDETARYSTAKVRDGLWTAQATVWWIIDTNIWDYHRFIKIEA